ncbi:MAG: hypothetical protein BAA03_10000 [Caldibacillus debilis]|nr:MAG: hypothetical protein BAA03_10000 [Caldibacillus debilis]
MIFPRESFERPSKENSSPDRVLATNKPSPPSDRSGKTGAPARPGRPGAGQGADPLPSVFLHYPSPERTCQKQKTGFL